MYGWFCLSDKASMHTWMWGYLSQPAEISGGSERFYGYLMSKI